MNTGVLFGLYLGLKCGLLTISFVIRQPLFYNMSKYNSRTHKNRMRKSDGLGVI